jgi:hypothetical protein
VQVADRVADREDPDQDLEETDQGREPLVPAHDHQHTQRGERDVHDAEQKNKKRPPGRPE